jgi:hypothetical protein
LFSVVRGVNVPREVEPFCIVHSFAKVSNIKARPHKREMLVLSYLEQETRVMTLKDSLAIVPIVLGLTPTLAMNATRTWAATLAN